MAWWRRRHKPTHASPPVRRQATWLAPAFPPEVEEAVAAAVAAPPPPVVPEQRMAPAVRLGFDDGSEMHLSAEDPHARALQAVADLLVKTEPVRPTTNSGQSDRGLRRNA
jgi:hypothetical protein